MICRPESIETLRALPRRDRLRYHAPLEEPAYRFTGKQRSRRFDRQEFVFSSAAVSTEHDSAAL
jgi:hypothetical protein